MKKMFSVILAFLTVFLSFYIGCDAAQSYSWYCIRTPGNRRPPRPGEFGFIENFSTVWIDGAASDDSTDKVAYLTFDAGYENGNIARILNVLRDKNVHAAFFILKNMTDSYPDLVKRMRDEGHTVCNHTAHHPDMTQKKSFDEFSAELKEMENAYRSLTGSELSGFYRPPEGKFNEENLKWASDLGYTTVFWSFAYADWDNGKQPGREQALKKILGNVHNGVVLLLHPTSETNADILGTVIDEMRKEGYRFGTLEELAGNSTD